MDKEFVKKFHNSDDEGKQKMIDELFKSRGMWDLVTSNPKNALKFGVENGHWYIIPVFPYETTKARLKEMFKVLSEVFDNIEMSKDFESWKRKLSLQSSKK